MLQIRRAIFTSVILLLLLFMHPFPAFSLGENEITYLAMYFSEQELEVLSATRSLEPISRVAENIDVVTKDEIRLMNAHTLADVLNTVIGVNVRWGGATPGSLATLSVQGSAMEHVVVLIDGVRMNIPENANVGDFPSGIIEKVEIVKGSASSVWGSSLGGIVNVITKMPPRNQGSQGTLAISYGEHNTMDVRAEAGMRKDALGLYLYGGRIGSDGLRAYENLHQNTLYGKLIYDFSHETKAGATFYYGAGSREEGDRRADYFLPSDRTENFFTTFFLITPLAADLELSLDARFSRERFVQDFAYIPEGGDAYSADERKYGATAKVTWRTGIHTLVGGIDYDYREQVTNYLPETPKLNVAALFVNDTVKLGSFTLIPGLRYDHTDRTMDMVSPSLGATYALGDKTLLRAILSRGFHLPAIANYQVSAYPFIHNPDLKPERVWSYQGGIESAELKYLFLKMMYFRHDLRDMIVDKDVDPNEGTYTAVNAEKARREGFEFEARTAKYQYFSLGAGYTYVNVKNLTTGETIKDEPQYLFDFSLRYDDEKSLRGLVRGRYVWWHMNDPRRDPKYNGFIVDANVSKTIWKKGTNSFELIAAAHNLFNGSQYWHHGYKNARRWFEGGVRYTF